MAEPTTLARAEELLDALHEMFPMPSCPCCEGVGEHDPECTFAADAPLEAEQLQLAWDTALAGQSLVSGLLTILQQMFSERGDGKGA